jgi:putative DNA primase/helicase
MPTYTDVQKFLQAVFGADYGTHAILANLNPAVHVRSVDQLDPSRDCYWSIAAYAPGYTGTNTEAAALEVRALVIDDVGTKVPEGAVELALGKPTRVTLTSAGNYQWAYRLTKPVAVSDWAGFFGGVEALIAHPLEARAAQTLMRLPMGKNTKPQNNGFQVQAVEVEPGPPLDPDTIPRVKGTSSAKVGGSGGWARDIEGLGKLIPNNDDHYDLWEANGERFKAAGIDKDRAFRAFEDYSARSSKYDPDDALRRWNSFKASKTSGKELLTIAAAADPDGFAAWQAAESREAFPAAAEDDPDLTAAMAAQAAGGVDFFVDQERSSMAVVAHLAGTLKCVGRDDWREFDPVTGRWREWTGNHMFRRVLEMVHARKKRAMDPEVSKKLGSVKFIEGIARAAGLHASIIGKTTDFDRGALLLGVPSGVIDLSRGASRAVRPGRALEMVSKAMWVDPAPPGTAHPEWSRFLSEFTQGDAALEEWLQVRAGYCLTGLMDEYIMPFYHGSGGNGKSVYLNALRSVWGEYGAQMEHRLLFEKSGGYHLAPLAVLAGIRLAIVTDVPQGASWDVHIMKMLTGDDAITANRMHQNPITFKSTAKVDVSGNGEPTVRDMDEGIRRRLKLIPLTAQPKNIDKALSRKLAAEWGAILSWALTGLDMYWALGGLPASKMVDDATREYHALLDPFQRWLDECVVKDPSKGAKVSAPTLLQSWDAFKGGEGRHGMAPASVRALIRKMEDHKYIFSTLDGYKQLRGYKLAKTDATAVF